MQLGGGTQRLADAVRLKAIRTIAATVLPIVNLMYSGHIQVFGSILAFNLMGGTLKIIHAGRGGVAG